jgi:hypothetical protein
VAHSFGSTALALSMHMHQVATIVWRRLQGQSVDPILRRIAAERLVLVSTGASDWLNSSGTAERVEGGYRISDRKIFSGSPAGDLLMTTAVFDDPVDGATVLHFPVPMKSEGVTVLDNWRALGMRATGSNDVVFENVFIPESAVSLRRPRGKWHPFYNAISIVAMPIVMSAYVGVADAARASAGQLLQPRRNDRDVWYLVGELDNALTTGQMAVKAMIDLCNNYAFTPDIATANAMLIRKTIATQALMAALEKGGRGCRRRQLSAQERPRASPARYPRRPVPSIASQTPAALQRPVRIRPRPVRRWLNGPAICCQVPGQLALFGGPHHLAVAGIDVDNEAVEHDDTLLRAAGVPVGPLRALF